jgi:hypothetical protein
MARLLYALEKDQPKRLEIDVKYGFKDASVKFDGIQLLTIPDKESLIRGVDALLPDNSTVHIQLQHSFTQNRILVTRNGKPLPGSGGDPQTTLKTAYGMIYVVAGFSLIAGFLALLLNDSFLNNMGLGWGTVIMGAIFAVLGFFTQRKSKAALIIAIVLYAVDAVAGLVLNAMAGASFSSAGLVVRIIFIGFMIPGVKAIDELKKANPPTIPNMN